MLSKRCYQIVVKQCQADVSFDNQIVQCKQQKFNKHIKYICLCFDDKKVGKPHFNDQIPAGIRWVIFPSGMNWDDKS